GEVVVLVVLVVDVVVGLVGLGVARRGQLELTYHLERRRTVPRLGVQRRAQRGGGPPVEAREVRAARPGPAQDHLHGSHTEGGPARRGEGQQGRPAPPVGGLARVRTLEQLG